MAKRDRRRTLRRGGRIGASRVGVRPLGAALTVLFTSLALAACDRSPTLPQGRACSAAFERIAAQVDSITRSRAAGGGLLYVATADGVLCERALGHLTLDYQVPIASASKWLTAATLMTLVDEGRLSLDAPIHATLPQFDGAQGAITLRQLLSHTSGYVNDHPCLFRSDLTLTECASQIANVPPERAPGTMFSYAGTSFQVAGAMAEAADGRRWKELFAARIARPLGMKRTDWGDVEQNPILAGAAFSTVHDYGEFLRMMLRGGTAGSARVLSAAALAQMQSDATAGTAVLYTPREIPHGYGLGEWIDAVDGAGRATQVSSVGASGFLPWIDTQRGYVAILMLPSRGAGDAYWYPAEIALQQQIAAAIDAGG